MRRLKRTIYTAVIRLINGAKRRTNSNQTRRGNGQDYRTRSGYPTRLTQLSLLTRRLEHTTSRRTNSGRHRSNRTSRTMRTATRTTRSSLTRDRLRRLSGATRQNMKIIRKIGQTIKDDHHRDKPSKEKNSARTTLLTLRITTNLTINRLSVSHSTVNRLQNTHVLISNSSTNRSRRRSRRNNGSDLTLLNTLSTSARNRTTNNQSRRRTNRLSSINRNAKILVQVN